MVCIYCGSETKVTNSRHQKRNNQVWRRRECLQCRAVFTTNEVAQYDGAWRVHDQAGRLQPFSRDKLFLSLHQVCVHRGTAAQDAGGLTETVIKKLAPLAKDGTISRASIIQVVQVALNRFDQLASLQYQALHKA
jgi:transcriptional regulator NrdR family protein